MSLFNPDEEPTLDDLRRQIDAIDAEVLDSAKNAPPRRSSPRNANGRFSRS